MIGVIGDRRGLEMADRVAASVVVVGELFPQAVDVVAPALERQVSEHVIKRAVLEHQHDDVVDLLQIGHARVLSHHTPVAAVPACHRWPPVEQAPPGDFGDELYVPGDLATEPAIEGRAGLPARRRRRPRLPGQLDLKLGAVIFDLKFHFQMHLIGDVGHEPEVPAFDDDIVVGGKLVSDRMQARAAASRVRVVFSFNSTSSK